MSVKIATTLILTFITFNFYAQQSLESLCNLKNSNERTKSILLYFDTAILTKNTTLINDSKALVEKQNNATINCIYQFAVEHSNANFPIAKDDYKTIIAIAEKYRAKSGKIKNYLLESWFYFLISDNYRKKGENNKAFEYKLYCLDALKKDPKGQYFEASQLVYRVALEFYRFKDYVKAAELAKKSYELHEQMPTEDIKLNLLNTNLAGLGYLNANMVDSALPWLKLNLDLAVLQQNKAWIGIATGNIGRPYFEKNNIASAIPYFTKGIELCTNEGIWDNVASNANNLAFCFLKTDNYTQIPDLLLKARNGLNKMEQTFAFYKISIDYFTISKELYTKEGKSNLALQAADSVKKYEILEQEAYSATEKIQTEGRLAYRNKELETQVALQKVNFTKLLAYGLAIAFVLLIVAFILFIKRKNLRFELHQQKLINDKKEAEEELKLAAIELKSFTKLVDQKNDLILEFSNQIAALKLQNNDITTEQIQQVELLKQSAVLTDNDWNRFKNIFDKIHPTFIKDLIANYPNLTNAEIRYFVFTKLELTPKEMCSMLGISAEAARSIRFRIKKKLQLQDGEDIDKIVAEI